MNEVKKFSYYKPSLFKFKGQEAYADCDNGSGFLNATCTNYGNGAFTTCDAGRAASGDICAEGNATVSGATCFHGAVTTTCTDGAAAG